MIGAIVGDIVGSVYEFDNIKTKEFPLFRKDCFFTDDTVMTIAAAKAIMDGGRTTDFAREYKKFGRAYPGRGYGGRFGWWLSSDDLSPYNSFGNGSAMRVSPCGWARDLNVYAQNGVFPSNALAEASAAATHNHPEGIKGAQAVSDAIYLARIYRAKMTNPQGQLVFPTLDICKNAIRKRLEQDYHYDLSRTLDEIRPVFEFDETCQKTVPEAVTAFLESSGFEDAIRNAISLGGDSDTIAAITGSIAEAAYGIPQPILKTAMEYLDQPLRELCAQWNRWCIHQGYIPEFEQESQIK